MYNWGRDDANAEFTSVLTKSCFAFARFFGAKKLITITNQELSLGPVHSKFSGSCSSIKFEFANLDV